MATLQTITLGCSKNTVDTEHILAQLDGMYDIIDEWNCPDYVDVLLINTCGFIGDAKQESVDAVLEAVERKRQGKAGRIIVFGCLSQRYSSEMPGLIPEVDGWYGARDTDEVVRALGAEPQDRLRTVRSQTGFRPGTAFLKISEGCDRRCSYCAIPLIRGPHRSVPIEKLVEEAAGLAEAGVRELVLIAQDTTYYGLDLYGKRSLAVLLDRLSGIPGIEWIRIHYSYPEDFPEDVLMQMATNPKVCPYLDIPLQHISNPVLKAMRRHVDSAWTRSLISRLRKEVPAVVLRTTMMVGHPGEGQAEFEELLDFIRETRFERLGAFAYSEEEGTYGAAHFADDVPDEVKQARLDELMETQRDISLAYNQSRVGTLERVLVDYINEDSYICRSRYESPEVDGEIVVKCEHPDPSLIGDFLDVKITAADEYDLTAEILR